MIAALGSPKPLKHLVLGRAGLENVERQLESMLGEIRSWEGTSIGADFPAPAAMV